jgi:RNA polymerase sigma factor (sigma-70 family)
LPTFDRFWRPYFNLSAVFKVFHSDYKHVEALLSNDSIGIRLIYAQFSRQIERYICRNSGNVEDARDVFQEALITIARQASNPEFALTCPFEAYLFIVCQSRWLNELKKRQRQKVTIAQVDGFEGVEEAELLLHRMQKEENEEALFGQCFNELPETCQKIIKLNWSGMSMGDVAKTLGRTYAYVRKRKTECLKKLTEDIRNNPNFNNTQI